MSVRRLSIPAILLAAALLQASAGCSTREPSTNPNPDPTPNPNPVPNPGPDSIPAAFTLAVQVVISGLQNPVALAFPPGDARSFIVEQRGRIMILQNGQLLTTPFLDIQSRVRFGGEQGLLGLAFHPEYATNGWFYVNYTGSDGATRIERYSRSAANPNIGEPASDFRLLTIAQPYSNHNGGMILFAPDGMLWIGMGDGGSGGDPHGNGQDQSALLGSMLRIDVGGSPYIVPPDNPYVGQSGARPEIWAKGLRNPWRFAIDRQSGLLYIADVGQGRQEEVSVVPYTAAGLNYGWKITEGSECYGAASCDKQGLTVPLLTYEHSDGCSITGGYSYRGQALPELRGRYFYSDYCSGWLRSFRYVNGIAEERRSWNVGSLGAVLSFGEDLAGELYILSGNGRLYKLVRGS